MSNNKIYICHQYYTPEHFKALYDCAEDNGYHIEDYIVLSKRNIIGRFIKQIKSGSLIKAFKLFVREILKIKDFKRLRGQIIIVGLAPYDFLMTKYEAVFKRNKSIYFTSFTGWDTDKYDRGAISNRDEFLKCLKESFIGAACVSKQTASELKKYINTVQVVAHAIDSSNYIKKTEYKRNKKYIFIGRVTEVKNIRLICEWFKKHREYSVTVVGNGDEVEYVKGCCLDNTNITYAGTWTKGDIKNHLHSYDYLILPSKVEPYGIVLLEALASGVPCIVSNTNGPSEIIENNKTGFVFDLTDAENAFNDVMIESSRINDDLYSQMSKSAVEISCIYSSEYLIKKWISLFE